MANFNYTAKSKDGSNQKGTIIADSQAVAMAALKEKGLQPLVVKEAKSGLKDLNIKLPGSNKVKTQDIVMFTRQLSTMVNAGVPLVRSLDTLRQQTDSDALGEVLSTVVERVEGGGQLSDALAEHPKVFSDVYVNMIKAGEEGGILDQITERLANQVEKDSEMKGKVKSAMIYPAVILCITAIAFIFIMVVIIPEIADIFEEFGGELPMLTQIVIAISNFMVSNGIILLGMVGAAIFAFVRFIRTTHGKLLLDGATLKLPVLGPIIRKVNTARFARTFSSLSSAGVSVVESLNVTAGALSNTVVQNGLRDSVKRIENGESIAAALAANKIFPPIVTQMAAVGEETGQIDVVLDKIAEFYEKEVDRIIAGLTSIIEPILIVVLGGIVGTIVASVFGPIMSLSQNI